ncbi:MAG: PD40 domain-containing protein, partial [Acidobacteria bacterium]|nr:PD40 domain-containing protein [Acidobacteriota bacterium]
MGFGQHPHPGGGCAATVSNTCHEVTMYIGSCLPRSVAAIVGALLLAVAMVASPVVAHPPQGSELRPMTFLDVQQFARPGSWTPSPDGEWMLYTITTPDWQEAESQSDIYLVNMREGLPSTVQMTFTEDNNETSLRWARDGSFFTFVSNREGDDNQLYAMRPNGGEARRVTDAAEGVRDYAFSDDGRWLAYRSGESGQEQLYRLPVAEMHDAEAEQITDEPAGIESWRWAPDSAGIYFTRPDSRDADNELRIEEGFTVDVKNMETPLSNLWMLDLNTLEPRQLTDDPSLSVSGFNLSEDGRWVTFTGGSAERYERNITGSRLYADQFLLETSTGRVERLTDNFEVGESLPSISPDGRWVAFSAPDDMTRYTMT